MQCLHWQVLYSYSHLPFPCFPSPLSSSLPLPPFPLPCPPASKGLDAAACHCCHGGGGPCLLRDCDSSGLDQVLCCGAKDHGKPQSQSQLRHYISPYDIITCTYIRTEILQNIDQLYSMYLLSLCACVDVSQ